MQRYSISYATFKGMSAFLSSTKVYYMMTDTLYTLAITDVGRDSCWTCTLLRSVPETAPAAQNLIDFEVNVLPTALLVESVDDAIAQHIYS